MPNPTISHITLPNGNTYDIKDEFARSRLASSMYWIGVTTTELVDNVTTSPTITVDGQSVTAETGGVAQYGNDEFCYNGTKWQKLGSLLGSLAYKNSASGSFTPQGSVSVSGSVTLSGTTNKTATVSPASSGTATYTPQGSVSVSGSVTLSGTTNKTATVSPASSGTATYTPGGNVVTSGLTVDSTTITAFKTAGTLPSFVVDANTETLTLSAGTLPTGEDKTVGKSGALVGSASFSGTGVRLVTGNIPVPNAASFDGSGSFTGTPVRLVTGNIPVPNAASFDGSGSFTGTSGTVTVS